MDFESKTKEELTEMLYDELLYYSEDLHQISKILCKQLPRKMIYRVISKLYRIRNAGKKSYKGEKTEVYEIIKDDMVVYKPKDIKALLLGIRLLLAKNRTEPNIKIEIHKTVA